MSKRCFIKMVLLVTIGLILINIIPFSIYAQNVTEQKACIKIEEIVQDEYIKGKVTNLKDPQRYKVLIYVHTDKWYIHPYAGQDEGMSWAAIRKDGSWSIPTVKRQFKANKIAALIVDPSVAEDAPSPLDNIETINYHAIIVYTKEEMKRKEWYGKL